MTINNGKLILKFYSDFIWPFCYIAERASLAKLEEEFDIEIEWHGFELHPETPKGGMELALLHPNQKSDMGSYIQKFAARFGINDMAQTTRLPNTRRALAMAEYARDQRKLTEFRSRTMNAHWQEGKDIEDTAILRSLVVGSGLDPEKALMAADDPAYLKRVDDTRHEFKKVGTGGIPTFIFGTEIVEGCAPYENLAAAARHAGAKPKSQPQK